MESNRILPSELVAKRLDAEYYGKRYRHVSKLVNQCGSVVTLEDVRSANTPIRRGIDMPKFVKNSKSPVLVTIASFEEPGINFQSLQRIDTKQHNTFSGSRLEAGNLLVAMGGYAGCAAICPADTPQANIGRHTARIVVDPQKANKYYLWAFIRSNLGTLQFEREITGAVKAGINLENLRQILIPAPSKLVQTYIGNKVRLAERLRERLRQLQDKISKIFKNFNLTELAKGKTARVPASELIDSLNPNAYMPRFLDADRIIRSHRHKSIKSLAISVVDGPFGSNLKVTDYQIGARAVHPVIRVKNCENGQLDRNDFVWIDAAKQQELARSEVQLNDLLVTKAGRIGSTAVYPDDLPPGNITSHLIRARLKPSIDPYYVAEFLETKVGRAVTERNSFKSTRPELTKVEIESCHIALLDDELMHHVGNLARTRNSSSRYAMLFTTAAKLLVEALIEGKVTEDELKTAQEALQRGDRELDQIILSRLTYKGIDIKGEPPLFPNLDALYDAIAQATSDGEEES